MFVSITAIIVALAIGYVWSARGFFSALLNLGVILASGAIAFGLYEPLRAALLGAGDGELLRQTYDGAALVLPFVLSSAILSALVNSVVRANTKVGVAADWAGGIVCGLAAGLIVGGFFALAFGRTRIKQDFLEYTAIETDNGGSMVRSSLLVPLDEWVVNFYAAASRGSLFSSEPLALHRPHFAHEGPLNRVSPKEMMVRYGVTENDFRLLGRYTVAQDKPVSVQELVGDNKPVLDINGRTISGAGSIEGYVLQFRAGAREKFGQVVVSPATATLVLHNFDRSKALTLQPIAAVSQARGDSRDIGRWRFDTKEVFIASAGADAEPIFALEFVVPSDPAEQWKPAELFVRGVRVELADSGGNVKAPLAKFTVPAERDAVIAARTLFGGAGTALSGTGASVRIQPDSGDGPIRMGHGLPLGMVLDASTLQGLTLTPGNQIREGRFEAAKKDISSVGVDRSLRVTHFHPSDGQAIVMMDVGLSSPFSTISPESSSATGAPALIDDLGQRYEAIGYYYEVGGRVEISFFPARPLTSLNDAPSISRSRDDQKLLLIFRVSVGVKLKTYAIGTTAIKEFSPLIVTRPQDSK
jgi:hypothetical protein